MHVVGRKKKTYQGTSFLSTYEIWSRLGEILQNNQKNVIALASHLFTNYRGRVFDYVLPFSSSYELTAEYSAGQPPIHECRKAFYKPSHQRRFDFE